MKDFNKDKFNKSLSRKFSDAEVQPGTKVWEGIEAELLKQDNRRMQKKAIFYRNVAAAVIFIALISIYFNLQDFGFVNRQTATVFPVEIGEKNAQHFVSENDVVLAKPNLETSSKSIIDKDNSKEGQSMLAVSADNKDTVTDSKQLSALSWDDGTNAILNNFKVTSVLPKIASRSPQGIELPKLQLEIKDVSYFAVSAIEKSREESSLKWNTNLNIGSGNFNPNSEITETPLFSTVSSLNNQGTTARTTGEDASFANNQEREAVADLSSAPMQGNISFTFGFNFGVILNERWNVRSGLQYGAYRSSSSSSTVLRDRNSDQLYPYHGASSSTEISDGRVINVTSEYELYNDFQIVTLPLMASYKIIDRKFDVSLVGGLSADFIIKNTLKGGSDQINDIKFDQNDKQSYKNIFASSMAGVEFSYPFADKYAISVMPTYKKALSSVTRENATFNSTPAFMGLNMSLAYMF